MSDEEIVDRGDTFDPFEEPVEEAPAEAVEAAAEEAAEEAVEDPVEAQESPKEEPKEHMIPKSRFDQAVRKERSDKEAMAAELKRYQERDAQLEAAADFEEAQTALKEMVKEHTSLLADGELDKASDVMENILQLQSDMANIRAETVASTARERAKQEVHYDTVVQRLEVEYPEINPDAEEFDRDVVRRVQAYVTGIMQNERKAPAIALQEAVEVLLKPAKQAAENLRQEPTQEAAETGMRRKEAAVKKNLEAATKQPASTKDVGLDHDKEGGSLDASAVAQMTWEEFVKLPDDQLSKMRGDFVN